jgi:hypothetical protein
MNFEEKGKMNYIYDGEVHSLDEKYFYIIERYSDEEKSNLKYIKRKFLDKYIWYLFSVDFSHSEIENIINSSERNFEFTHKKPGKVIKFGTYFMKFKKENR